jgi:hypothetical protein
VAGRGTTAAAATSAGVSHPMVMRSRATDRRRGSKCQRKLRNQPLGKRSGCQNAGSRPLLASVL